MFTQKKRKKIRLNYKDIACEIKMLCNMSINKDFFNLRPRFFLSSKIVKRKIILNMNDVKYILVTTVKSPQICRVKIQHILCHKL